MRNKVEITGINTSELEVMPHDITMMLIKKSQEGDIDARNEVIEGNLKLVLSVIKKFSNRGENADDLFQVGTLGLIKAVENFDFTYGVKFSTYAVPMVIGEIRRYLRDNSKLRVPRSLKDIAYKAMQYKDEFYIKNYREPTTEEIAKYLNVEEIDVVMSLEAMQEVVSIYTPIYNSGGDEIYLIDQISDPDISEEKRLEKIAIEEGIAKLNPRLKGIILNRYFKDKTQMEIAEELGISQAQVSRLEKSALKIIFDKK